ncbi:hypothetical protein CCACVL1_30821 [Corchorus capsularis]|uniref:Uncharacterized protein n=1 Tax=Corchorus capsularis TaxID=210143 RepID=A0A1R3FV79_COCAP|nr:hypothetical protein CCACVL1_30821 [Corchorus capsularis]
MVTNQMKTKRAHHRDGGKHRSR